MFPIPADVALSPLDKVGLLAPFILIGVLILAAAVAAVLLIVRFAKKKK
ncbi:MAG: hypothetical protein J5586_05125 [Clostridia bacterium]|nr:hypothetical protein [Clostridia bacterium]